ncbi:type II toxin-antitoxin system RelE/ParE family toxin [Nocardia brasiliensis]|uniref:type II toxin-antitoxin system RelE/ParE family toxin n=1 Tax=Nocardia brasiliensis TaxID=37326 RepID=UPI002456C615|nr:type II toxin-antitoxin system RelE/ParE family toxin [Nocardia brasiliensis]
MTDSGWDIYVVDEVRDWITQLDEPDYSRVVQAIDILADYGPGLGRPLVDTLTGSKLPNLKELRTGTTRILFAFAPWRSTVLLVAGDKDRRWRSWYRSAIPLAEHRYETYLKERREEMENPR